MTDEVTILRAALKLGQARLVEAMYGDADTPVDEFAQLVIRGPRLVFDIGGEEFMVWHGDMDMELKLYINRVMSKAVFPDLRPSKRG